MAQHRVDTPQDSDLAHVVKPMSADDMPWVITGRSREERERKGYAAAPGGPADTHHRRAG
jgi:hypothetical protein